MSADISVVIAAHNAEEFLAEQLDALAGQSCDLTWEVLVVDNNSRDATSAIASSYEDRLDIRVISATQGRGAGYARNVGVAEATGRWLIFVDADDAVADGWLAAMATALQSHDWVAGPTELDRLNETWVADSRGRSFSREATRFFDIFPYASTCNVAMARSAFEGVGGFDEEFYKGQDLELSLRLWQHGVELHFEPDAVVHYRLRPSLKALFKQSRQFGAVHPVVLERLRSQGIAVPSRFSRIRQWAWLVVKLPLLRTKTGRAKWLWVAGTQVGRFQGGLSVRRLYL